MSLVPAFELGVWNAWIFMVCLLIQNLVIMANKRLYRRFGEASAQEPSQTHKIVNFSSTLLWLLSTAYSIFVPLKLGTAWFPIGLTIFLSGLVIIIVATVNFATTSVNEPVTGGAYRYSRHPIYAALLLIYLAVSIASASWIFLLVTIVWMVLVGISTRQEEGYCPERYGAAYSEYMKRSPR